MLGRPSSTVTTKTQRAWVYTRNGVVERLMWRPRDYAAAMGMADFKIPKSAILTARLCGNAVCPAVMSAIVRAIKPGTP